MITGGKESQDFQYYQVEPILSPCFWATCPKEVAPKDMKELVTRGSAWQKTQVDRTSGLN